MIDLTEFNRAEGPFNVKYGLPPEVTFCKSCVISNQRPNSTVEFRHTIESKKATIHFDEEGVCDACRFWEKKRKTIDWDEREAELKVLCDRYRRTDGYYDCLVPGSGGKDSFYAAHVLKYKYNMHPLTVTWAPHIYTDWGLQNFNSWVHAGFDNIMVTPNGRIHRLLTRLAVENLFHPFQPFILGQKNLAPKMAIRFNIPLVFYGENEAEYGNPIETNKMARQDWRYYTSEDKMGIYLAGVSVSDLIKLYGFSDEDLLMYSPPDEEQIKKADVEVHHLGYYLYWHPQSNYYYSVEHGNFVASPERTAGTYSKYNSIDDKVDDLHYYTTLIKFGIGRATYDASQEIRSGDITREEGVALVKKFDQEFPDRFMPELMQYLSIPSAEFPVASNMFEQPIIDKDYFLSLADKFRSPHLWAYNNGVWELRHKVWEEGLDQRKGHEDEALTWQGNRY